MWVARDGIGQSGRSAFAIAARRSTSVRLSMSRSQIQMPAHHLSDGLDLATTDHLRNPPSELPLWCLPLGLYCLPVPSLPLTSGYTDRYSDRSCVRSFVRLTGSAQRAGSVEIPIRPGVVAGVVRLLGTLALGFLVLGELAVRLVPLAPAGDVPALALGRPQPMHHECLDALADSTQADGDHGKIELGDVPIGVATLGEGQAAQVQQLSLSAGLADLRVA